MKSYHQFSEAIKGWKHAHSDIMKYRAQQGKEVVLHRLKKDGAESGMHDARNTFRSEAEAREHHQRLKSFNPGKQIRHHLYVPGKEKEVLD